MQSVGQSLRRAGVRAIYLVHGTFVGNDGLGVIRAVTLPAPQLGDLLRHFTKHLADAIAGETGNYTPQYVKLFQEAIATAAVAPPALPVRLFNWSSENHHIGRAHAAVRLIDELNRFAEASGQPCRIVLWGHSHAGNVFALVSNLLAADAATLETFFVAARPFYCTPLFGKVDVPVWQSVSETLRQPRRPLDRLSLDVVTFGTPVRYGWDTSALANLLHFVNHRPADGLPEFRVPFPPRTGDVLHATFGDSFQQLGIAGTGLDPAVLTARSWLANRRLRRLLQGGVRRRDLLRNLAHGMRVPEDGTTLLVDYKDASGNLAHHLAGHAVYTRREWLLFHAEEVCRRFYAC